MDSLFLICIKNLLLSVSTCHFLILDKNFIVIFSKYLNENHCLKIYSKFSRIKLVLSFQNRLIFKVLCCCVILFLQHISPKIFTHISLFIHSLYFSWVFYGIRGIFSWNVHSLFSLLISNSMEDCSMDLEYEFVGHLIVLKLRF